MTPEHFHLYNSIMVGHVLVYVSMILVDVIAITLLIAVIRILRRVW